jgi:hypothetical protein
MRRQRNSEGAAKLSAHACRSQRDRGAAFHGHTRAANWRQRRCALDWMSSPVQPSSLRGTLTSGLVLRSGLDPDQIAQRHNGPNSQPTWSSPMYQTGTASPERTLKLNDSPFCSQCGSSLRLIRVEPILGFEKHTLRCPGCGRGETILIAPPPRGTT